MKKGEEQFVSPEMLARTLTGTGREINQRLDELEAIGVNNVAISVTDAIGARDLIEDFGREVIAERA